MKTFLQRLLLITSCVISLSSCGTSALTSGPVQPRRVAFNEANFAPYLRSGSATVTGQICITFVNGSVRFGRNISVDLVPFNAYSNEVVERMIIHHENLAPCDPRYDKYVRSTMTDALGNFEFRHVPAGEYFVGGVVEWEEAESVVPHQQSWAWERLKVGNGQAVRVTVTQ